MWNKISSVKWRPFCPGGDELIETTAGIRGWQCAWVNLSAMATFVLAISILRFEWNGWTPANNIFKYIFLKGIYKASSEHIVLMTKENKIHLFSQNNACRWPKTMKCSEVPGLLTETSCTDMKIFGTNTVNFSSINFTSAIFLYDENKTNHNSFWLEQFCKKNQIIGF